MKRTIIMTIIVGATLHGYAQNAAENFLPRANDEVKRQQVAYASQGNRPHVTWSFVKIENRLSKTATII
ncbi:MAG: hypothetical protein IJP46_08395 [Prevotella sp.]|nr:hypothetical protein [Prevotella sp.]